MELTFSLFLFLILIGTLITERLFELAAAKRNTARLIAEGGREFGDGHYKVIVIMHVAFFLSLITEYQFRGEPLVRYWVIPFLLLVIGQSLRLWSRHTMAGRWTSRIIVVPHEKLIARGPYALLPHPIYCAVALELFSLPLIFHLYVTSILFTLLNAMMLLLVRIQAEKCALAWSQQPVS